jgi:short-subunit dehydrogenase
VLLTGASGGLGHAIARELASAGATLLLTARRADVLEPLAAELGRDAEVLPADLADRAAVEELAERAGQVDVLVANAALPASGPVDDFTVEQIDRALDVNLRAAIVLARLLSVPMAERGAGHIVFISSLSGKVATPGSGLYSATKFGMRGFALALREDLRPRGVGVSTIFPGFIREAGMFADAGVKLPPLVGTRAPGDVGRAVRRAIERDRSEIDVAPALLRLAGKLGSLAPEVTAAFNRRSGAAVVSERLSSRQRSKR